LGRLRVKALQGLTIAMVGLALGPVVAAEQDQRPPAAFPAAKTGKERLTDKATDEQRVDDCRVPQARRTRARPTECPGS
jgi:hypothetical protein